jgi:hypothetical protein
MKSRTRLLANPLGLIPLQPPPMRGSRGGETDLNRNTQLFSLSAVCRAKFEDRLLVSRPTQPSPQQYFEVRSVFTSFVVYFVIYTLNKSGILCWHPHNHLMCSSAQCLYPTRSKNKTSCSHTIGFTSYRCWVLIKPRSRFNVLTVSTKFLANCVSPFATAD